MENELLNLYPAKITEYALAISYLVLFVMYWRWVNGAPAPGLQIAREAAAAAHAATQPVVARRPAAAPAATAGWFTVPDDVLLHPGHTWAREEANGLVTIGLDDFAHKLIGPATRIETADLGETVAQGGPAIRIAVDGKTVSMLSPVDGTVLAVNRTAGEDPRTLEDPYGAGWLFKVRSRQIEKNRKQLLSGTAARRWLEGSAEALAARLTPALGHVLQDGGTPVHGIGREIDPEHWDEMAKSFFLS